MTLFRISGGTVYDPTNNIDGEVRDLWIQDGRVIAAPSDLGVKADKTLDATGYVVMPGGVDMHCHIAGPKVNTARKMMPDVKQISPPVVRTKFTRSGTTGSVPSTFATGYLYAGLGYTSTASTRSRSSRAPHQRECSASSKKGISDPEPMPTSPSTSRTTTSSACSSCRTRRRQR